MSKLKKMMICIMIIALTVTTLNMPVETQTKVQAATKKEKALKSYLKELKSYCKALHGRLSSYKFALIDLNGDKIPEFLYSQDDGYHLSICAYINGKAKKVGYGFSGGRVYYPNIHIYSTFTCHTGENSITYYRFDGKKMIEVCSKYGHDEYNAITGKKKTYEEIVNAKDVYAPYLYKVNGKRTTKAKYNRVVKGIKKKGKKAKIVVHKATKKNIRKYLDKNYLKGR